MILGTYKREYPRGYVMRGWDPQNPTTLSSALPVATSETGKPEDIQPGMIISTSADGKKWIKGVASNATLSSKNSVAFAQDGVERWDVMAADSLVGLKCSGKFRFATPFFARMKKAPESGERQAATYVAGTPLTYCVAGETESAPTEVNVTTGALVSVSRALDGFIRPAEAGEPVIGVVAETHSGRNRAAAYTDDVPARADQESIGLATESTAKFTNAYMVIWDSAFQPAAPTA